MPILMLRKEIGTKKGDYGRKNGMEVVENIGNMHFTLKIDVPYSHFLLQTLSEVIQILMAKTLMPFRNLIPVHMKHN